MKISNSQIMSFQKCERRFYYEHVLKLRPKQYPEAMERGIFGHGLMEAAFRKMQAGGTYEECVEALNPLIEEATVAGVHANLAVYKHVLAFLAYAFASQWKPVQVEESSIVEIERRYGADEDLEFAFTIDCIFEWTTGPKKGRKFAIDFKFTGQYWNDRELSVYQQLPKYMIYTNKMYEAGDSPHKITNLAVIMLNTRAAAAASGTGLFQVKWLNLNKHKLERIEEENEILIHRIVYAKTMYTPEMYLRTVDSYMCKMCFFADNLCPAELEGRNIDKYIERDYEVNTYFDDNYETEEVKK